jgi:uncharacterized protein YodC (DUF2158 family)
VYFFAVKFLNLKNIALTNSSFKVGDVVVLKNCKEPTMVIREIDGNFAECSYFQTQKGEFTHVRFHIDQIMIEKN